MFVLIAYCNGQDHGKIFDLDTTKDQFVQMVTEAPGLKEKIDMKNIELIYSNVRNEKKKSKKFTRIAFFHAPPLFF